MKFNEETMKSATEEFLKNDFWLEIYEKAPEGAKKRLRIAFWGSRNLDAKEDLDQYRECRERTEDEMSYEDAAYLAEHMPKGTPKEHYTELRDRLELRPIKTVELLDEACGIMLADATEYDRSIYEKTRATLKKAEDPLVKYEWLWGAVGGNGDDAEWLCDLYDHGHGVEPDEELAFYWARKAALNGSADGCDRLAIMYEREGPRHDMPRAFFWYREALRRKSAAAKIDLGARLTVYESEEWEARRNPELGVRMLRSALKEGHSRAAFFLGKCQELGVGTARDLRTALYHYQLAAKDNVWGADDAVARVRKQIEEGK